jgi:hypothetical protein
MATAPPATPPPAPYRPAGPAVGVAAPARGFVWHSQLAEARAAARAQHKMILVGTTKPGCGLCEKFRHQVAPSANTQLSAVAVGYMFDLSRPSADDVPLDRLLRTNLPGASLMPLVGFVTPDLQWIHGFWGPRDLNQFLGDIAVARRTYPVHAAAAPAEGVVREIAFLNEYGETEWSLPGEVFPGPEDALGPLERLAVAPAAPAETPVVADARPAPATPAPDWSANRVAAVGRPDAAGPVTLPAPAPEREAPAPPSVRDESWAEVLLAEALVQLRAGQFDQARAILAEVNHGLPGTEAAREADRGCVAVYHARRIHAAAPAARDRLRETARLNLARSPWESLFEG